MQAVALRSLVLNIDPLRDEVRLPLPPAPTAEASDASTGRQGAAGSVKLLAHHLNPLSRKKSTAILPASHPDAGLKDRTDEVSALGPAVFVGGGESQKKLQVFSSQFFSRMEWMRGGEKARGAALDPSASVRPALSFPVIYCRVAV